MPEGEAHTQHTGSGVRTRAASASEGETVPATAGQPAQPIAPGATDEVSN